MAPNPSQSEALQRLGYELDGVLADTSNGGRFDDVCRGTVQRVRSELASLSASEAPESTKIADFKRQLAAERDGRMRAEALVDDTRRANESLRAQIDALMLEYCPEDMTKEQTENWKHHQVAAGPEAEAALDASLAVPAIATKLPTVKALRMLFDKTADAFSGSMVDYPERVDHALFKVYEFGRLHGRIERRGSDAALRSREQQAVPEVHQLENVMLAARIPLPLRSRAERFLRTSAPHHRSREWYQLIEQLLAASPDARSENKDK